MKQPQTAPPELAPQIALRIAIQALEAALRSLDHGDLIEARDAIWQGLTAIKQK